MIGHYCNYYEPILTPKERRARTIRSYELRIIALKNDLEKAERELETLRAVQDIED